MVLTNGNNSSSSDLASKSDLYEVFHNLSSFITLEFEPVGKWFEQYNFLRHQGDVSLEDIAESSESEEDEEEFEETPEYKVFLETLDPKNWKDQDHYKVLGLENLRWKATQHQIKKAHKHKVLKYHPDKMKEAGVKERDIFTCITKAFEFLSDPVKRKSYDSVDSTFDEVVPSISETNKKNFYKVFGDAFERNSRWSIRKPVPKLGDEQSTFDEINDFYSFWYDFDSWREFSYLDEESKESASDRDERRWIDKQNKAARAKRKKEETARLRQLVDNAYASDPRILKFKQEEKRRKEEEKLKRKEAARLREEELLRKQEEARREKEKHEEEERLRIEAEKKEKEQQKKLLKKERKSLRTIVKDFNYFADNEDTKVTNMEKIEQLIEYLTLNEIQNLNESIQKSESKKDTAQESVFSMLKAMHNKIEEEARQQQEKKLAAASGDKKGDDKKEEKTYSAEWVDDEIKLLVKGLKIIPVGTRERWEVIANFINEHSRGKFKRSGKEVLAKTKDMQKPDNQVKEDVNKKAFEKALQNKKAEVNIQDKPTERYISPGEQFLAEQGSNLGVWTSEEQKALEQALKTYPSSLPDRWDRIAECIPTRSKKDCMVRYKELVELIQAKKKAQQAVAGKS